MIYQRQPKISAQKVSSASSEGEMSEQRSRHADSDPENVEEEITGYNLRVDGDEEVESVLNIQELDTGSPCTFPWRR